MAVPEAVEERISRLKGIVCLPYDLTVVFPTECPRCPEANEMIKRAFTRIFKGCTYWDGRGTWIDARTGKVEEEAVRVTTASHSCPTPAEMREILRTLGEAGRIARQKVLFIKTGKAFIVPPEALSPG